MIGMAFMALDDTTRKILKAMPFSFLLIRPDEKFTILEASDDYLDATLTNRASLIGTGMFESFPDHPTNDQSRNVASLYASFEEVIQTKKPHSMEVTRYDVPHPTKPEFEVKYWLPTNLPVVDSAGDVIFIIHRVYDLTTFVLTSDAASGNARPTIANQPLAALADYTADLQRVVELLTEGERRRLNAEIKATEARERLDFAVDGAELGTFYCPMPLEKIFWNDTCKAHFFLPPEADIDIDLFYKLIHPDDREHTRVAIESSIANKTSYDVEYRVVASDGRQRWLRAKGRSYYDASGQPIRFDGITIDIDRQKIAEEELRRASQQKDEFLAMLAHELRNPLAPITAAASILMLPNIDPERIIRTSGVIARQAKHMTELINDLLDVSRVSRGMVSLEKKPVDVKTVVSAAIEQVRPLIENRKHQLTVHLTPETAIVLGDEKRLIQVVANILNNAVKFTPEAGHIDVKMDVLDALVTLSITDTGIGMPSDLVGRVFDLFVQGQVTPDRSQGGLGLGLSLVRSLVGLHEGTVAASSQGPGQGSRFTVSFPLVQRKPITTTDDFISQGIPTSRKLSILVVDDNVDAAKMLAIWLEALGHNVRTEHVSSRALDIVRDIQPDVCVLDIGMPGMDGNELARRIRANDQTKKMTLIAVTGYGQEQDKKMALDSGFDHHYAKPVDLTTLGKLLSAL